MRRLRIYVGTEHPHAQQACPSTQYNFKKWQPKTKQREEESASDTLEDWKVWEQELVAHKGQPEDYLRRIGGIKLELKPEDNGRVTITQQVIKGLERTTMKHAAQRRTRRTERFRALVEGINQDIKAEKLWRERLH